jgi:hypothetical protein
MGRPAVVKERRKKIRKPWRAAAGWRDMEL